MTDQLSNFERVKEFHTAMDMPRNVWPPTEDLMTLRRKLITEEYHEAYEEMHGWFEGKFSPDLINKANLAKELADILYVVYGAADAFGIPIDEVFAEVHRSNMSKLVDGKPLKREDGKVLKGPNYTPPNLEFVE